MKNFLVLLSLLVFLVSCGETEPKSVQIEGSEYDFALKQHLFLFDALPVTAASDANPRTAEKVTLGHALYFDTRLSLTGNNSCNSCHNLATFGVDGLPTSEGDNGGFGDRNSPTVLNAALHSMQFWDARAADVEEQAGMPILNPVEMAIPEEDFLVERLSKVELYKDLFAKAYPEEENPITYANIQKALASFERELLTPSRFDQYMHGDKEALSMQEKQGMMSFVVNGCTTCHNGALLGGNSIQKFGVYDDYWKHTGSGHIDEGLAALTGNETDKYIFKTPSLRNVAETGPYLHDGSLHELEEVIRVMGKVQLNKDLTQKEIENIAAFLGSLTGNVPESYQKAPAILK